MFDQVSGHRYKSRAGSGFCSPGTPGFAACRITALRLFYLRCRMFNFDFGGMIVALILAGALIGGAIVALVLLALPWLWAIAKPALHAWTA